MSTRLPAAAQASGSSLLLRLDKLGLHRRCRGQLNRRSLSAAHLAAAQRVGTWMQEAGMRVTTDALFSGFGRWEGERSNAPAIMLGSHLDTGLDAGRYDGALGVLAGIAVVAELSRRGERLWRAIEVAAFGEKEGSRFPTHILTSSALTGAIAPQLLDSRDRDGILVREALATRGGDDNDLSCVRKPGEIAAYLELHIEQGPVLEGRGLALGAVTAIDGSVRLHVTVSGVAGHAGTVPMHERRDALAAASEMLLAIERLAASENELVATVGQIEALPGAPNVIPAWSGSASTSAAPSMRCARGRTPPCARSWRRSRRAAALLWRPKPSKRTRPRRSLHCYRCRRRGDRGLWPRGAAPAFRGRP